MMKLEKQKARMVMFVDRSGRKDYFPGQVLLGVKIDSKLYEIEYIVDPFTFGPIANADFCNITASFGEYDLETVDGVFDETDTATVD